MVSSLSESVRRIYLLGRLGIAEHIRAMWVALGATSAAFLVIYLLSLALSGPWNFHDTFFPLALVGGGVVVTSMAFGDLHVPHRSEASLMLPVSAAERVIERILTTYVLFAVGVTAAYALFSAIAAGMGQLLIGRSMEIYLPVDGPGKTALLRLPRIHAIYLFGAIYFRRKNLLKTLLTIALIVLTFLILTAGITWASFGDYRNLAESGWFRNLVFTDDALARLLSQFGAVARAFGRVAELFFRYLLTPVLWILTWLRLRETEAVHGV